LFFCALCITILQNLRGLRRYLEQLEPNSHSRLFALIRGQSPLVVASSRCDLCITIHQTRRGLRRSFFASASL
jgi:hypothetical protein